jgi:hypothetical protein
MDEIKIVLDLAALKTLMQGGEIIFTDADNELPSIVLACDESATQDVKMAVQMAMLNLLPPAPGLH